MLDYAKPLADTVKRQRLENKLTQGQVADMIDVDPRTIMNIENYKGNPKLEILFPLVRALKIDSQEIFYPDHQSNSPYLRQLNLLIGDCSEQEIQILIPIIQTILSTLRSKYAKTIE